MSGWYRGAVKPDPPDPQPLFVKRKLPKQRKGDLFASPFIPFLQAECQFCGESRPSHCNKQSFVACLAVFPDTSKLVLHASQVS